MLVRIPELPAQETTTIYMFYGNPLVDDESDDTIFTWMEITGQDLRLSWTLQVEGAWDPDVAYGGSKFIVAWEEGAGPGYSPDQNHRLLQRQIHVRLLDTDVTITQKIQALLLVKTAKNFWWYGRKTLRFTNMVSV